MSRKFALTICLSGSLLIVLLALGACNYPRPGPADDVLCDADDMAPVLLLAPGDMEILEDNLQPTFSWSDPNDCQLESYAIHLYRDSSLMSGFRGYVDYPEESWQYIQPLEEGRQYWWEVLSVISSSSRDDGGIDYIFGPLSEVFTFFTGPQCDGSDLVAPSLLQPEEGEEVDPRETISTEGPLLMWEYPGGCLPDQYQVLISKEPGAGPPLTVDHYTDAPTTSWGLDVDLEENTTYYWKVRAIHTGTPGPFSEVGTFVTKEIAADLPGVIAGQVWHDVCDNPLPRDALSPGDPIPEGCVDHGGSILGDGVKEENEPGIPGLVVQIHDGSCPGEGLPFWYSTNEDGIYYAYVPPGTYCVFINPWREGNADRLLWGTWSNPIMDTSAFAEVTVELPGELVTDVDFGWDYDDQAPEYTTAISGRVWIDADFNWQFDPEEIGMEDAVVFLVSGYCDESWRENVLQTASTDGEGLYAFSPLEEGDYCVAFEESSWFSFYGLGYITYREYGSQEATRSISLGRGEHWREENFGWTWWPHVIPEANTNCRAGPSTLYPIWNYLEMDEMYYLDGRNTDNTWWYTELGCWVSDAITPIHGDPEVLPFVEAPPPPDVSPPRVTVSYSPRAPIINDRITYTAEAVDDRTISKITIFVSSPGSGGYKAVKTCENTGACTHVGGPYDNGLIRFYAKAWDEAGNEGVSGTIRIFVEDPYL